LLYLLLKNRTSLSQRAAEQNETKRRIRIGATPSAKYIRQRAYRWL
jgi:hypothetical protein